MKNYQFTFTCRKAGSNTDFNEEHKVCASGTDVYDAEDKAMSFFHALTFRAYEIGFVGWKIVG